MKTLHRCALLVPLLLLCFFIPRAPPCTRGNANDVSFFVLSTSERRSQRLALDLAHHGVPQTFLVYGTKKAAWSQAVASTKSRYIVLLQDEAVLEYDFLPRLMCLAPLDLDLVWLGVETLRPEQDALGIMIKRSLLENVATTADKNAGSGAFELLCHVALQCTSYALITRSADASRALSGYGKGDIFSHVGLPR